METSTLVLVCSIWANVIVIPLLAFWVTENKKRKSFYYRRKRKSFETVTCWCVICVMKKEFWFSWLSPLFFFFFLIIGSASLNYNSLLFFDWSSYLYVVCICWSNSLPNQFMTSVLYLLCSTKLVSIPIKQILKLFNIYRYRVTAKSL